MTRTPELNKHTKQTDSLTPRNLEVLKLVAEGYLVKEVASKIYLSNQTTKRHLHRIREALEAKTNAHAVAIAIRQGIIE